MFDDRTVRRDLAQMRRYVMWSLLPIPVAFAGMNIVYVLTEYRDSPLGLGLVACVVLAAWAAFVLCYLSIDGQERPGERWFGRRHWAMFALGMAAVIVGLLAERLFGPGAPREQSGWPMLTPMVVAALVVNAPDGKRTRVALIAAGVSLLPAVPAAMFLNGGWVVLPPAILLLTFVMWSMWWIYGVSKRLDAARRVGTELAVAQERLRFAAELHDIQGHHLQVIALKSELAARLSQVDPDTAVTEMREVERLAREALTDTRAVVGGYRDVRLRTELANAVRVLGAAGINARHGLDGERIEVSDPAVERLLGLAVREATTNMIRHASPSLARLNLETDGRRIRLTVRNDGAAESSPGQPESGGLTGLAERFTEAGGELAWHRSGAEFVVTAEVGA